MFGMADTSDVSANHWNSRLSPHTLPGQKLIANAYTHKKTAYQLNLFQHIDAFLSSYLSYSLNNVDCRFIFPV